MSFFNKLFQTLILLIVLKTKLGELQIIARTVYQNKKFKQNCFYLSLNCNLSYL